jgi:hypothetical protein
MDSEFRELNSREKDLLERLLSAAPHGRDELRTQLNHIKAEQIEDDGTLRLQCHGGTPSRYYTPVAEGVCKDADGADIAVILHLRKGGFMSMLEIIKYDGSQIMNPPSAENLAINSVPTFQVLGPGSYRRVRHPPSKCE